MSTSPHSVLPRFAVVTNELPAAPYPAEIKANGYRPEVDWQRIKASKTWRLCPPEQRSNLFRLWMESWNEVPAGSWDNDDEIIAEAIDMPIRLFQAHRDQLMRGWYLADDGRLYHPVITDMVLSMVDKRRGTANRVRKYRETQKSTSKLADTQPAVQVTDKEDVTRYQHVSNAQEQDKEKEEERDKSLSPPQSPPADAEGSSAPEVQSSAPDRPPSKKPPSASPWPRFEDFWAAYPRQKAKEDSRRAWNRLRLPPAIIDTILADLPNRAATDRGWLDGYIPNPATYLIGRRWEDVITPVAAVKSGGAKVVSLAERNAAVFDDFLRDGSQPGVIEGECRHV